MSRAQVSVLGVPLPEQFKTDWSQFMKEAIRAGFFLYPHTLGLLKATGQCSYRMGIPKAMHDRLAGSKNIYFFICFKNDLGQWESNAFHFTADHFVTEVEVGDATFMAQAANDTFNITGANVTQGNVYDVTVVMSENPILEEVAENSWDVPYSVGGKAAKYVVEVTCGA